MFARSRALRNVVNSTRTYATSVADSAGVKVAGVDLGQPTTSISVVVKAGSRYETLPGVAHALKNFAFKATSNASSLKIVREAELYGGVLSSGLSREHLFLNAEFLRGDQDHFVKVLASVLSASKYHPHEFSELVMPTLQSETLNAMATPSTLALDLAHHVAFRRGLGNSLFASPHSPLGVQDVKEYASKAFAKSNIAVFGTGISTEALSEAVGKAFGGASSSSSGSSLSSTGSKYYGGEQRVPIDAHSGGQPTMVIAFGTTEITPELNVIPELVGGASALKWVPGTTPLAQAASKVPGSKIQSFHLPYSDAALVGVSITAPTSEAVKELAKEVVNTLKGLASSSGMDGEAVTRAVAAAKFKAANALDNKEGLLAAYAPGIFSGKEVEVKDFSSVSAETLSKTAGNLLKSKPSVVAVGDLAVLPWADELGL
jgi:ubiquinol-cytochrome c reductase core subunit 2